MTMEQSKSGVAAPATLKAAPASRWAWPALQPAQLQWRHLLHCERNLGIDLRTLCRVDKDPSSAFYRVASVAANSGKPSHNSMSAASVASTSRLLNQQPRQQRAGRRSLRVQAAGSTFGHSFRVTTFGESHGGGVGCVIDGVPPRLHITQVRASAGGSRVLAGQHPRWIPRGCWHNTGLACTS